METVDQPIEPVVEQPAEVQASAETTPEPTPEPAADPAAAATPPEPEVLTASAEPSAPDFASMTAAQVHAGVVAGTLNLGGARDVLCSDGHYVNPFA